MTQKITPSSRKKERSKEENGKKRQKPQKQEEKRKGKRKRKEKQLPQEPQENVSPDETFVTVLSCRLLTRLLGGNPWPHTPHFSPLTLAR